MFLLNWVILSLRQSVEWNISIAASQCLLLLSFRRRLLGNIFVLSRLERYLSSRIWNSSTVRVTVISCKSIPNERVKQMLRRMEQPICPIRGVSMSNNHPAQRNNCRRCRKKTVPWVILSRIWLNWSIKNWTSAVRMRLVNQGGSDCVSSVSSVHVASTESIGYIEQWCNVNRDWRRLRRFINCQYRIGDSWCLLDLEWSWSHPCIHVSNASCWSWCTTSCPFSVIN